MKKGHEVMFNPTCGVYRTDNSPGKVARARGVYEDKLVVITPIQGVLDSDVSHTSLYNNLLSPPMEKLGTTGSLPRGDIRHL
jgi:hypothetical protein